MHDRWGTDNSGTTPSDIDACARAANLLGAEEDLVLSGGGNVSVKADWVEFDSARVPALYVSPSGMDLARVTSHGLVPLDIKESGFDMVGGGAHIGVKGVLEQISDQIAAIVPTQHILALESRGFGYGFGSLILRLPPHRFDQVKVEAETDPGVEFQQTGEGVVRLTEVQFLIAADFEVPTRIAQLDSGAGGNHHA